MEVVDLARARHCEQRLLDLVQRNGLATHRYSR